MPTYKAIKNFTPEVGHPVTAGDVIIGYFNNADFYCKFTGYMSNGNSIMIRFVDYDNKHYNWAMTYLKLVSNIDNYKRPKLLQRRRDV
jgi:hypothetical protein